jgi:hypothetical protein
MCACNYIDRHGQFSLAEIVVFRTVAARPVMGDPIQEAVNCFEVDQALGRTPEIVRDSPLAFVRLEKSKVDVKSSTDFWLSADLQLSGCS